MAGTEFTKKDAPQIVHHEISTLEYSFSGPLPPPEILEKYEKAFPGSAKRIFDQFESQSDHRRKVEWRVVKSDTFAQIFGLVSGFILGMIALGGGLVLVYLGRSITGFSAFFLALASFVGVYIYGKHSQMAELKSKQLP